MNHIQTKTIPSEAVRHPMIQAQQDDAAIFVLSEDGAILEANSEGMGLLGDTLSQFRPDSTQTNGIVTVLHTSLDDHVTASGFRTLRDDN